MPTEFRLQKRVEKMYNLMPPSSIFYGLFRLFLCVVNGDEKLTTKNPKTIRTQMKHCFCIL